MIDAREFAATLGPRVFLLRSQLGLPHREVVSEWAMRHGGYGLVIAPRGVHRVWQDAWPALTEADVVTPTYIARHPYTPLASDGFVVVEEPSLNWDSKQYKAIQEIVAKHDTVLVTTSNAMHNFRRAAGAFRLIVEGRLTPTVMK